MRHLTRPQLRDRNTAHFKKRIRLHRAAAIVTIALVTGCDGLSDDSTDDNNNATETEIVDIGAIRTISVNGTVLSSLPQNPLNPPETSVALGRMLFWDPILSGNQDVACASCHLPEFGYTDGRRRSAGVGGVGSGPARSPGQIGQVTRNSQSVINTVWNGINELGVFNPDTAPMFWDGRTTSLEAQAIEPILSREEMRGDNFTEAEILTEVINRINSVSEYQAMFETAYGSSQANIGNVAQALADFQRTLVANNTPFDRYLRGDTNAMSNVQINGMQEFVEHDCAECHSGPMFSDFELHVLGVAEANGLNTPDTGNGNFAFRTPSLRQLAFTAPYFHGGQEVDLNDAIDFYDNNNNSDNPNVANNQLDPDFRNIPNLNNNEINAIEAFLSALNDGAFDRTRPDRVPSGLSVGGAID